MWKKHTSGSLYKLTERRLSLTQVAPAFLASLGIDFSVPIMLAVSTLFRKRGSRQFPTLWTAVEIQTFGMVFEYAFSRIYSEGVNALLK